MAKISLKPGALLSPVPPALVSCGDMQRSNILTIAWTGMLNTIPPMTYISVRPERYSYGIIRERGEFVINLTSAPLVRAADYCGVKSGAQIDKFAEMHLTKEAASQVACPLIGESPLHLECRVRQIIPLGSHDMFLAEIVAMEVDSSILDESGRICLERAGLAAYAHGTYYELGKKLGSFGYSVRKKKKPARRRPQ